MRKLTGSIALILMIFLPLGRGLAEPDLSAQNIQATVEWLTEEIGIREAGTPMERAACDGLAKQLSEMGFSEADGTLERSAFEGLKGVQSENLMAVCNGKRTEGPLISIVAHYDSVATSPGARDNAAAVGILLEIARLLGTEQPELSCEVRMVFLGSEENGYHGAHAYVQSLSEADRARHLAAFNMDISAASEADNASLVVNMLGAKLPDGRYMDAEFLPDLSNAPARAIAAASEALYGQALGGVFCYGESDHVRFHEAGLEAVNVCWRRVEDGLPRLPESYHQMTDTAEDLDYDTALMTGRCLLAAVKSMADAWTSEVNLQ